MASTLGIIKATSTFHTEDGVLVLGSVKLHAAVEYRVPAKNNSWQAAEGKDVFVVETLSLSLSPSGGLESPGQMAAEAL